MATLKPLKLLDYKSETKLNTIKSRCMISTSFLYCLNFVVIETLLFGPMWRKIKNKNDTVMINNRRIPALFTSLSISLIWIMKTTVFSDASKNAKTEMTLTITLISSRYLLTSRIRAFFSSRMQTNCLFDKIMSTKASNYEPFSDIGIWSANFIFAVFIIESRSCSYRLNGSIFILQNQNFKWRKDFFL